MHTEWVQDMGALLVRTVSRTLGLDAQRLAQSAAVHQFVDRHVTVLERGPEWMQLLGLLVTKKCNQILASQDGSAPSTALLTVEQLLANWNPSSDLLTHPPTLDRIWMSLDPSERPIPEPEETLVDATVPTPEETIPDPAPVLVGDDIIPTEESPAPPETAPETSIQPVDDVPAPPTSKPKRVRKRRVAESEGVAGSSSSSSGSEGDMIETPAETHRSDDAVTPTEHPSVDTEAPKRKKKRRVTPVPVTESTDL